MDKDTDKAHARSRCRRRRIRRFHDSEEGASAFEYAVMLAGIAIATTMLANTLGFQMASTFSKTEDALHEALDKQEEVTRTATGFQGSR